MFFRRYRTELLIALGALVIAACFWPAWMSDHPLRMRFPFDDTYITFRYAEHVAHGFGMVWNAPTVMHAAGPNTEGYTNFLFMLLLVPFVWMGTDLTIAAQAVGVLATIVSAIAMYRIVAGRGQRHWPDDEGERVNAITPYAWFAVVLFLFDPFTWMNAYSGMETTLFAMWILCAVWAFAAERMELAFALSTLATLTRPEGALVGMILLAVALIRHQHSAVEPDPEKASPFGYWVSAFALPLVLYGAWKWWYFGNPLPNSFYVKVASAGTVLPGRGAVRIFYEGVWWMLPFAIMAIWKRRNDSRVTIAALWAILLSLFYCFSNLIQNEYSRFFYPIEALLLLLTAIGFGTIFDATHRKWIACVFLGVLIALGIFWPLQFRHGAGYLERTDEETNPYPRVAAVLRSIPDHADVTMAWGDAGKLAYFSGLRWIDPVGLNTNWAAHAHSAAEIIDSILAEKPELIIIPLAKQKGNDSTRAILSYGHGPIGSAYPALARAALAGGYKPIALVPMNVYDLDLLVDTTSIFYPDIEHTIVSRIGKDSDFLAPAKDVR